MVVRLSVRDHGEVENLTQTSNLCGKPKLRGGCTKLQASVPTATLMTAVGSAVHLGWRPRPYGPVVVFFFCSAGRRWKSAQLPGPVGATHLLSSDVL